MITDPLNRIDHLKWGWTGPMLQCTTKNGVNESPYGGQRTGLVNKDAQEHEEEDDIHITLGPYWSGVVEDRRSNARELRGVDLDDGASARRKNSLLSSFPNARKERKQFLPPTKNGDVTAILVERSLNIRLQGAPFALTSLRSCSRSAAARCFRGLVIVGPRCTNTSDTTPDKLFVAVPKIPKLKKQECFYTVARVTSIFSLRENSPDNSCKPLASCSTDRIKSSAADIVVALVGTAVGDHQPAMD
ncbi:hypothetical protein EVAR_34787_1 [Eumeta japonica]|uniref:Uncharacterized protein n=1 Tax=Eumeta variegata TaxID=151549 RepID=A0A4C1WDN9_EUMVA|nr:hypothetical protein EVAR_34787_1 [Eumeta japonica]